MNKLRLTINGHQVKVPTGSTVAAAIAITEAKSFRHSVSGAPRAPLCGMGICFECRVTINGQQHRLSCQTICEEGMTVVTTSWTPAFMPGLADTRKESVGPNMSRPDHQL